jgi:hypothetical protein
MTKNPNFGNSADTYIDRGLIPVAWRASQGPPGSTGQSTSMPNGKQTNLSNRAKHSSARKLSEKLTDFSAIFLQL